MKKILQWYLPLALYTAASLTMSSCFIQKNAPLSSLTKYERGKDFDARTISVPMALARPLMSIALKKENESAELRMLVEKLRHVRVMTVQTNNNELINDLRHENWRKNMNDLLFVKNNNSFISVQVQEKRNRIRRLYIRVLQPVKKATIIQLNCKLNYDQLSDLVNLALKNQEDVANSIKKAKN